MTVQSDQHQLPASHTLTVSVVDGKAYARQVEDSTISALVTNAAAVVFGPYLLDRSFIVQHQGNATAVIAEADVSANIPSADQKALLDGIPTEDAGDGVTIWNDAGVLKVSTAP